MWYVERRNFGAKETAVAHRTFTIWVGDEDEAEVLDRVTDGLTVEARLLDYSAGGSPTFRFEGSATDLEILRERVGGER
jgi:hypothetical protein